MPQSPDSTNAVTAVILAAGSGTRMKSQLNKMLHPLAGRPLFHYPLLAAWRAGAKRLVVVASPHNRAAIADSLGVLPAEFGPTFPPVEIAIQERPLGSGDAARAASAWFGSGLVLIVNGDAPLLTGSALEPLIRALDASNVQLAIAACELALPTGYGRILRDSASRVLEVREEKDLRTNAEREVREVNAGMYCGRADFLTQGLARLTPANAQGEYYITDLVAQAAAVAGVVPVFGTAALLEGVNDRAQLDTLERRLFERIANGHRLQGVTVRGDAQIDDAVSIGQDTVIHAGVSLRGRTRIGAGVVVDAGSIVVNATVEDGAVIKPYCVVTDSHVGAGAQVGPFAHLRPGSTLEEKVAVGNFVETKATRMRRGAKANHLSYLGDGDVGEGANIGAGTIFCNYDGFSKARTTIGNGAFIGSDSQLVAPVTIGDGAYVATGTTVTQDVPADALAIARIPQVNKPGYASRLKARLKSLAESKGKGQH